MSVPTDITLSNTALPRDTTGHPLITGETSVVTINGTYYFYVNNWGGCAAVDCCDSPGGCASCCYVPPSSRYPDACVFTQNHSVVVYATRDFQTWQPLGVALSPADRPAGIEFRPHVVFNKKTATFVMWFENRPDSITSAGYSVATSTTPHGPFRTVARQVAVADVPGDFDLLIDDDGTCWHVQTTTNDPNATRGFAVTALNPAYTAPAKPRRAATFAAPKPAEGPVLFQRRGHGFYMLGGTTCCACRGGASVYVFRSPSPLGPWIYQGDVGSVPGRPFDPHSPNNYVTHAQASAVIRVGGRGGVGAGGGGEEEDAEEAQWLWLGNQWVTGGVRNAGLLYWSVLRFDARGGVRQFEWAPSARVRVPSRFAFGV